MKQNGTRRCICWKKWNEFSMASRPGHLFLSNPPPLLSFFSAWGLCLAQLCYLVIDFSHAARPSVTAKRLALFAGPYICEIRLNFPISFLYQDCASRWWGPGMRQQHHLLRDSSRSAVVFTQTIHFLQRQLTHLCNMNYFSPLDWFGKCFHIMYLKGKM